jgi:DNA-binding IclR family transcriptional regulator
VVPQRLYLRRAPENDDFPFPSLHELFVLECLAAGPLLGVEIVKQSNGCLTRGTVYPMLHRLIRAGHVARSDERVMVQGKAHQPYILTGTGRFLIEAARVIRAMRRAFPVPHG